MTYQKPPDPDFVWYVAAHGDYVRVYLRDGDRQIVRISMEVLEGRWAPGFVRIHRSYLVPLGLVVRVGRASSKRGEVTLRAGSKAVRLPVTRSRVGVLRAALVAAAARNSGVAA